MIQVREGKLGELFRDRAKLIKRHSLFLLSTKVENMKNDLMFTIKRWGM
jgi:hypothetical protein